MNELKVKDLTTMDFMGLFSPDGKCIKIGTKDVADKFEKKHSDIIETIERRLESIKSIESEGGFADLRFSDNFELSSYKSRGKIYKEYLLTKDGFMFVVMGLEGIEAEKLKMKYINMFNTMAELILTRGLAKINYKGMSTALKESRERIGKETKWFHYSNEADMINKLVLGMTAKQFKDSNGIEIDEATRDMVPEWKLKTIDILERFNTELLEMDMEFKERESMLTKRYLREVEKQLHFCEVIDEKK